MSYPNQEKAEYSLKKLGFSTTGQGAQTQKNLISEIDVSFVYRSIKTRIRVFFGVLFVVLSISALLTMRKVEYFTATCRITLSPERETSTGFESFVESSELGYVERQTEMLRITSRKNIEQLANESSLNKTDTNYAQKSIDEKVGWLVGSFKSTEVFDTYMIDISCEWDDPAIAQEHANLLGKIFLQDFKERNTGITKKGLERLKAEASEILKNYEIKSQELHQFEAANNLISVDKEHQTLAILRLSSLMDYKIKTEHERLALDVELNALKQASKEGRIDFDASIIKNPKILALRQDILEEEKKLIHLSKNKGEQNIDVVNQRRVIDSMQQSLKTAMMDHIATTESEYNKQFQREKVLVESLTKSKEEYNSSVVEYKHLKNQVSIVEQSLNKILKRIEEIEISNTLSFDSESLGIYSYANLPNRPSRPNKLKEFSFGLLLAFAMGCGICLVLEMLDSTLKSKTEIEQQLGVPVISYVPKFPDSSDELPVINYPNSVVSESFRSLRTTIQLTELSKHGKIFMLTSGSAHEGKTVFSANLALSFQQQRKKVLLIETDFRKARLEEVFESEVKKGFSNYLMSEDEEDFKDYLTTLSNGLDILFAGPTPFNPTELLQSEKFDSFLRKVQEVYDYIFISSTPANNLSDSRIIAAKSGVVTLFVVRAYSSNAKVASAAVNDLLNVGAKIAGVIVNGLDVPIKTIDSYSEYTSYYGKYSDFNDEA